MQWTIGSVFGCGFLMCCTLGSFACGSDDATEVATGEPGTGSDGPSAVLVRAALLGPDTINVYVGAFPELPTGELDYSRLREFGNANVYTAFGYVFVEEAGIVSRFSVNSQYQLVIVQQFHMNGTLGALARIR